MAFLGRIGYRNSRNVEITETLHISDMCLSYHLLTHIRVSITFVIALQVWSVFLIRISNLNNNPVVFSIVL